MFYKGLILILTAVVAAALYLMSYEQRQEVARYLFFCILTALVVRPVGLMVGTTLKKVLRKDQE
jgi:hypothetical protein